ncbi:hypothetical protein [Streptomyces sp. NPDC007264]|uniref:hypothetical protein n=1 Tax=Streptomyces sp. NPDC007264 TaxID=3364777 RepID=UPI0036DE00E4
MSDFPFVYLNHGPLDPDTFGKADGAWIAFREPVSEADLALVARSCPEPIHGFFHGDDGLFSCESPGDVYDFTVAHGWGGGEHPVTEEAAAAFGAEVERWVLEIHRRTPIAFFVGPGATLDEDAWETWSRQQVGAVAIPWLERYLDSHPDLPQDDPGDAVTDPDDEGDWEEPITPMNREWLRCLLEELEFEFDVDGDEGPPGYVQRLETLISRFGGSFPASSRSATTGPGLRMRPSPPGRRGHRRGRRRPGRGEAAGPGPAQKSRVRPSATTSGSRRPRAASGSAGVNRVRGSPQGCSRRPPGTASRSPRPDRRPRPPGRPRRP